MNPQSYSEVSCANCPTLFYKSNKEIAKTGNNFCCRSCAAQYNNKHFPKRRLLKLCRCGNKRETYKDKKCLECRSKPKEKIIQRKVENGKQCCICEKNLLGKADRFCSDKCRNRYHQNYHTQQKRGIERKIQFIKERGGCCSSCGYKKNIAALDFHHTDPSLKDFVLTIRECSNNSIETLRVEFEKCELLCSNCHREYHYPDYNNLLT